MNKPSKTGDRLAEIIESFNYGGLLRPQWGDGCGCKDWTRRMNGWGPTGCEDNFDLIVRRLVREAHKRFPAAPEKLTEWMATKWLRQAIDDTK